VLALAAGAIGALALAIAGLLLGVVADLRDERGELFDLEAQGARPKVLRRHLRLRSLLVALFGIAGGLAAGIALSALVVDVVRVTANATAPEPPLLLQPDWALLAAATAGYAATAALLVGFATRRVFRGRAVPRAGEVG
jgi:ABC-type antimicrobial peptide transport system permease subunit